MCVCVAGMEGFVIICVCIAPIFPAQVEAINLETHNSPDLTPKSGNISQIANLLSLAHPLTWPANFLPAVILSNGCCALRRAAGHGFLLAFPFFRTARRAA